MGNKRLWLTALALALTLVSGAAVPALAQNGALDSSSTSVIERGAASRAPVGLSANVGWSSTSTVPPAFFWGGPIPVFSPDGPFNFTLATQGCVSVTDDFVPGDQFRVYDNGTTAGDVIGETPVVASGGPDTDNGPDVAYSDPAYSSATFVVGPGSHSISIEVIGASLTGGRGYIRLDTLGGFSPCDALLQPDLVVESLTHSPAMPDTEDTIEFTAVVKNIGGAAAGASTLSFKIGGESPTAPEATFSVPSLAPGASATFVRNEGLSVAQTYTNTAVADFGNVVAEFDEDNNTTTDTFAVTQAEEPSGTQYSLVSAPLHGDLYQEVDGNGDPVAPALGNGDIIADPTSLHYFPDGGYTGPDQFTYRCTDLATNLFDDAVVDILVSAPAGSGVDLTVDMQGAGVGDVTMDIGGSVVAICSADCTESFGDGDIVKLQARPVGLSTFGSWGGDCSAGGSSQIVTITLTASGATCTATFNNP